MKYDTDNLWQIIHKHGWITIWNAVKSFDSFIIALTSTEVSTPRWSPYNLLFSINYDLSQRELL